MTVEQDRKFGHPVPCRLALDDEVPKTAATMMRRARQLGWTAQATYASNGEHYSVVVRLGHAHGHRAAAWWTDGKADDAAVRVLGVAQRFVGVAGLSRLLADLVADAKRPKGYVPRDPDLLELDDLDDADSEPLDGRVEP